MKEPLRKVLGKALLSYQELATVLIKIEAVINSRPLTTVSDDVRDLMPITPAHLALGRSLYSLPEEVSTHESTTRQRYLYKAEASYLFLAALARRVPASVISQI